MLVVRFEHELAMLEPSKLPSSVPGGFPGVGIKEMSFDELEEETLNFDDLNLF